MSELRKRLVITYMYVGPYGVVTAKNLAYQFGWSVWVKWEGLDSNGVHFKGEVLSGDGSQNLSEELERVLDKARETGIDIIDQDASLDVIIRTIRPVESYTEAQQQSMANDWEDQAWAVVSQHGWNARRVTGSIQ